MTTGAITPVFLSRLVLNPLSRKVQSELAQPYEMHRTLMRAFPEASSAEGENARERYGVLFRADVDDCRDGVTVYVQSTIEPDWSFHAALPDYLLADADSLNPAWKDVTASYRSLQTGQVLSFRLRANPTKRVAKVTEGDSELKGKRVGLLREEEQIAWLIRKGQEREKGKPGGFQILMRNAKSQDGGTRRVPCVNVYREGMQTGRKRENRRSHETIHLAVRFDGLLQIMDANALRETLARGIGPAKAFGFGLLSVAPATE